jgi:hypothetical protein
MQYLDITAPVAAKPALGSIVTAPPLHGATSTGTASAA